MLKRILEALNALLEDTPSATDGWFRLSGYDASAVRAFVLAPEQEEEP